MIPHLILSQYVITAISSGFNVWYFSRYRSPVRRRRAGALTLALLSAATFAESIYFTSFALLKMFDGQDWGGVFFFNPSYWLGARLLVGISSLLVSTLILRHLLAKRG